MRKHGGYDHGYLLETEEESILATFEFLYPRTTDKVKPSVLEVGLEDVRATDSIRVTYDFDRDGWSILQASRFSWENDEYDRMIKAGEDPYDWQEVHFVPAWGRKMKRPA